nr:LytTR family DNA-binding domain-containing protein [uncultured Gemmiger sp.]
MKLMLIQDLAVSETEITIRYTGMDARLQRLIDHIRQFGFSITGYQENKEYQLPLETIFYIDSVDGHTFLYQKEGVYECRETLAVLENKLKKTVFVRISKNCILNTTYLDHVEPLFNHRLKAVLNNGETLVVTRSYMELLRDSLKGV